jgi:hypothetical protein
LTFERKIMSTKTSIKRIALVAVAALGFGVVTTVTPASAATYSATYWSMPTGLDTTNGKAAVGGQAVAVFNAADTSTVYVTFTDLTVVSYADDNDSTWDADGQGANASVTDGGTNATTGGLTWTPAADTEYLGFTVTRATAGSGTITVKTVNSTTGVATTLTSITIDFVASTSIAISQANSRFGLVGGGSTCDSSSSIVTDEATLAANAATSISYADTDGTRSIATCLIIRDGLGNVFDADSLDTYIVQTTIGDFATGSTLTRSSTTITTSGDTNDDAASNQIFGDGLAAGVGTVTVTAIEGTASVSFTATLTQFGEIAKVTSTQVTYAGLAADSTWDAPDYVTNGQVAVVATLAATDANGNAIRRFNYDDASSAYTLYYQVDTDLVAGSPSFNADSPASVTETGAPTVTVASYGTASAVGASTAYVTVNCGDSVLRAAQKLSIVVWAPDEDGDYTIKTDPITYYCSGAVSTVTVTPTETEVAAGGATTVNVTVMDAGGRPVADGTSVTLAATNGSTVAPSSKTTVNGAFATAASLVAGSQSASTNVTAIVGSKSGTASVTVTGVSTSGDALDAANEATDAANAATDAANAAAEAADAATAAAQDAQAAVAELATKVASLMAGIKAQITSLTNLVIKIQKKVKA